MKLSRRRRSSAAFDGDRELPLRSRRRGIFLLAATALAGTSTGSAQTAVPQGLQVDAVYSAVRVPAGSTPGGLAYPFHVLDIDQDGADDIVTGDLAGATWRHIGYDAVLNTYLVKDIASFPYPVDGDLNGPVVPAAGSPGLLVQLGNPAAYKVISSIGSSGAAIHDVATATLERIAVVSPDDFSGRLPVGAADLDNDGSIEIVFYSGGTIRVYDQSLTRQLGSVAVSTAAFDGIAVGQFDADANVEIVVGSGEVYEFLNSAFALDGSIASEQDQRPLAFLDRGDVDGDGIDEIFATYGDGSFESSVVVYDVDTGSAKWVSPDLIGDRAISVFRAADVNGDGSPDALFVESGHPADPGHIVALDGATGSVIFEFEHPDTTPHTLNVGDFDGDGSLEIATMLIRPLLGPNRLYVFDVATAQLEWRSQDESLATTAVAIGDLDGDDVEEIAYAPFSVNGVDDIQLNIRDAATFAPIWRSEPPFVPTAGTGTVRAMVIGDVDDDDDADIVIGATLGTTGQLWIVDGPTRQVTGGVALDPLAEIGAIGIGDVDQDGATEIVTAGYSGFSSGEQRVHVIDGASRTIEWSTPTLSPPAGRAVALAIGDIDGDSAPEIVVVTRHGDGDLDSVLVVDAVAQSYMSVGAGRSRGLTLVDVEGDAAAEIVLGHDDGTIEVIDGSTFSSLRSAQVCTTGVEAVASALPNGVSPGHAYFACWDRVGIIDLTNGDFRNLSAAIDSGLGEHNKLLVTSTAGINLTVAGQSGLRHLVAAGTAPSPVVRSFSDDFTHWRNQLSGDIDVALINSGPTSIEVTEPPVHGSLVIDSSTNTYTYQPDPFRGIDHFGIRVEQDGQFSVPTSLMVSIRNAAPRLVSTDALSLEVAAGEMISASVDATDSNNDPLSYELVSSPTQGVVDLDAIRGDFVYTADPGAAGTDSFSVRATDQVDNSETKVVDITISDPAPDPAPPPPAPPPASNPPAASGGGGAVSLLSLAILACLAALSRAGRRRHGTGLRTRTVRATGRVVSEGAKFHAEGPMSGAV